jgi:hypothetical protein
MNPRISSHFDGGAVTVVDATRVEDLQVALRPDSHADIRQWFYFRLQGAARIRTSTPAKPPMLGWQFLGGRLLRSRDVVPVPTNSTAPSWWSSTRCCATASTTPISSPIRGSGTRAARACRRRRARVSVMAPRWRGRHQRRPGGTSGAGRKPLWIIARQHPGDDGRVVCRGHMERLLDESDPGAAAHRTRRIASCRT